MIILAALGVLLSAAFFVSLIYSDNMLSAIRNSELANLAVPDAKAPAAKQHSGATWVDVYASLREELSKHPSTPKHNAVAQLLRMLIQVDRGKQQAASAASSVRNYVAADSDNLVSRLASASIFDEALGRDRPAMQRFESIHEAVEASPAATTSTLHNQEFADVWQEVLKRYIHHEDVALAAASYMDHYEISDHHAALPMIEQRLSELAKSLHEAGKPDEADQCSRWVVQMAIGLMQADRNSGTRLLCADMLAQLSGATSKVNDEAKRLRTDFYDQVKSAPVDLASPTKKPAVNPSSYSFAINTLVTSLCLALEGMGAAGLAILAGAASLFSRRNQNSPTTPIPVANVVAMFGATLVIALAPAFIIGCRLGGGLPSESWAIAIIPSIAALGAILPAVLAADRRSAGLRLNFFVPAACAIFLLLGMAAPPTLAARLYQGLGKPLLGFCLVLIAMAMLLAVAIIGTATPWRSLARKAVVLWPLSFAVAILCLVIHRSVDGRYREAVVAGYKDEFATRLGSDWEERYLRPIQQSYHAPTTRAKSP